MMTDIVGAVEQLFVETFGLEADSLGRTRIERVIDTAMQRLEVTHPGTFLKLLANSPEERERCMEDLVVPETWFFRDQEPFVFLKYYLREQWLPAHSGQPLRILSIPCSTGEEPYSIAMTLLAADMAADTFHIDAADISRKALAAARMAVYGKSSFRQPLSAEQEKFFQPMPQGLKVSDAVVRTVHFYRDNLVDPGFLAGHAPYQILFCKNVLIYLTDEARRKVLKNFDRLLAPQGILFTGHAETGFLQQNGFTAVRHPRAFACKRSDPAPAATAAPTVGRRPFAVPSPSQPSENYPAPAARVKMPSPVPAPATVNELNGLLDEAKALANRGLGTEAAALCQKYLRDHLPHADIYCLLGLIHEAIGRATEAEECYLKALYLDPDHYESLIQTSLLYQQKGHVEKALLFRRRAERREEGADERNR